VKEGIEYYIDADGKYVFTEAYHQQRGYCCGEACRHCPYQYENVPEPVRSRKLFINELSKIKNPDAIPSKD
jgi:hypothetical protein